MEQELTIGSAEVRPIEWVEIPAGKFIMGWLDDPVYNGAQGQYKLKNPPRREDHVPIIWGKYRNPQIHELPTFYISRMRLLVSQYHHKHNPDASYKDIMVRERQQMVDPEKETGFSKVGPGMFARFYHHGGSYYTTNLHKGCWEEIASSYGARLPTYYEWEKAARGTSGLMLPQRISPYGVYDMGGVATEMTTSDDPDMYILKCPRALSRNHVVSPEKREGTLYIRMFDDGQYFPLAGQQYTQPRPDNDKFICPVCKNEGNTCHIMRKYGGHLYDPGASSDYRGGPMSDPYNSYVHTLTLRLVKDTVDENDIVISGIELPEPTEIPPQPTYPPEHYYPAPLLPYTRLRKKTVWEQMLELLGF